jgi:hypothetical protein
VYLAKTVLIAKKKRLVVFRVTSRFVDVLVQVAAESVVSEDAGL